MSLGKIILCVLFLSQSVWAEGVPFQVSSSALNSQPSAPANSVENVDPETTLINDLKYLAVSNWLQSYLGSRYPQFDKYITPEFAEKYILDYKIARTNPSGGLDLVGHLDGDSLKKWIRLMESKTKGSNQIKPLLIVSSNLPGFKLSAEETASKMRDSSTIQLLAQLTQQPLQRLNTKLTPLDSSINIDSPPKSSSEIQSLSSIASRRGDTLVIWETFTNCAGCSSPRFDIFVYNTSTQNLAFVVGEDINLSQRDFSNSETVKRSLNPVFQQFQSALENAFSEGTIHDASYKIIFESVDSYRTLKVVENELSRGNGFSSPVFKKASGKSAEYEIKSSLTLEELAQRIQGINLSGLKPQISKVDSITLSVKLLK